MTSIRQNAETSHQPQGRPSSRRVFLYAFAIFFCLAGVASPFAIMFGLRHYTVASNSMSPTLMGDPESHATVLAWRGAFLWRTPRRWEIVVFRSPRRRRVQPAEQNDRSEGNGLDLRRPRITVKRVVGLPGETLALRDGDVWTRRRDEAVFQRRVKDRAVQDALWIPVYEAAFPETRVDEFDHYWRGENGGADFGPDGIVVPPGTGFHFLPWLRTGTRGWEMIVPGGVPDRYLLPQAITYECCECDTRFARRFAGGQIQERCPSCGTTAYEENILLYGRDSGLSAVGPHAAWGVPPGDANRLRVFPYHMVGDLRLDVEARLPHPESGVSLRLEKDGHVDTVDISASGIIVFNNARVAEHPIVTAEKWFEAAFSRVDGELRLAINGIDIELPSGKKSSAMPSPEYECASSGVSFAAVSTEVTIRRLSVSRDIHYFSGVGNPLMPGYSAMSMEGELDVPDNAFVSFGDNADLSVDSRVWGTIPLHFLEGAVIRTETSPDPNFDGDASNR
ncbi:MAG: S26 family signal peptidase [Planctomycetota bacterium]|jgi:signal peptidase I|nr:S26 family signal peptidase [Planctomycetota bacterium]